MTFFDSAYFYVFNYYKTSLKQKANRIAVFYITILQASLILFLGVLISEFSKQMHVDIITSTNAWTLFAITSLFLYFKNWMLYTGKKRLVINAKLKKQMDYNIWLLWVLPIGITFLSIILLRAF
jgi:hypothetical protein